MSEAITNNTKKDPIDLNEVTGYKQANKNKVKKNPNELDNDAFMKLFLEQLKNQDPTAPMETDKIITQTAQLTQVEMQEKTKQTMMELAEAMKKTQASNESFQKFQEEIQNTLEALKNALDSNSPINNTSQSPQNSINMIGNIAETKINGITIEENQPIDFELYFDEAIDITKGIPKIFILNEDKNVVREIDISSANGKDGYLKFTWDTLDNNSKPMSSGAYSIIANYNFNKDGSYNMARVGRGEVESVILNDNKSFLRLGELVVPLEDVLEFYHRSRK